MKFLSFFKSYSPIATDEKDITNLIKLLQHNDIAQRKSAAHKLGKTGDVQAVEPLISILENVRYAKLIFPDREAVVEALEDTGGEHDIDIIIMLLGRLSYSSSIGTYAISSMQGIAPLPGVENPLSKLLIYREWNIIRHAAARALEEIGDRRAVKPLIAAFHNSSALVEPNSADKLIKPGDRRVVGLLVKAYIKASIGLQVAIIETLSSLGADEAVETLIAACRSSNLAVSKAATVALRKISNAGAVEALIDALKDSDFQVREAAAGALGNIGDTRAIQPLIDAFRDAELHVYQAATSAVVKLGTKAIGPLICALKDSDHYVRRAAAEALEKIGGARLTKPIILTVQDAKASRRNTVGETLSTIRLPGDLVVK